MAPIGEPSSDAISLRKQAEEVARGKGAALPKAQSGEPDVAQTLHELQVHQIELELQNEELRRSQVALDAMQARYFDLYDLAPVGYCTLNEHGLIVEANLTATTLLGVPRGAMVKQPISRFIHSDDKDIYYMHRKRLLDTEDPQAWDMRMLKGDGTAFWGHLAATVAQDPDGTDVARIMLSDVTERIRVERAQAFLARADWLTSGEGFFQALARFLADDLGMDYVCIDRLAGDCLAAETLAIWFDGHFEDNVSYTLKDTPCGDVVGKTLCCFPSGVRHLFPKDQVLQDMTAESYLGATLWGSTGRPIGLIALIGRRPVGDPDTVKTTLDLVAVRASAELEHHEAEVAQRAFGERYRVILQTAMDGFWVTDIQGRLLEVNEAYCQMSGYSAQELLTMSIGDLDTNESPDDTAAHIEKIIALGYDRFETRQRCKNGDSVDVEVSVKCQAEEGRMVVFLRDITKRKQAEEEKLHLLTQLHHVQKMENLGSLAGGIAHDMNNVLGAILGLASANIEVQPAGSPAKRAFEVIIKAAERGGKMVRSLLTFARKSPAETLQLDMNAVLQEEARLLENTTLSKIRLVMDLGHDLRPISGDASALTHALMNLCVNAVDAMPDNGTLTFRTRNVDNDWIEVMVEDTGTGMPKEVLEKAMDPFYTTKEIGKGTGLGLSIVYRTVKAHQGQMEIMSEPGQGTRVRMRFPACEISHPTAAPSEIDQTLSPLLVMKVLLVDDDELIQSSMQTILEVLGHTVTTARSGEEALAKLEAGFEPNLVILDINMPGLGGIGTLPRLRALRPKVPVLLSTGRVDQTALELASAHAGVTLLSKPFSMRELQQHLEPLGRG